MKYYVKCGRVDEIAEADTAYEAAKIVMIRNQDLDEPQPLGQVCQVSETGFHAPDGVLHNDTDKFIRVDGLMKDCGFVLD